MPNLILFVILYFIISMSHSIEKQHGFLSFTKKDQPRCLTQLSLLQFGANHTTTRIFQTRSSVLSAWYLYKFVSAYISKYIRYMNDSFVQIPSRQSTSMLMCITPRLPAVPPVPSYLLRTHKA